MSISTSSTDVHTITTASTDSIYPRQRFIHTFPLLWLDSGVDEATEECQNTVMQLRSIVNNVHVYSQWDEAIDFLTELHGTKAFLIVGNPISQHIVSLIQDIPELDAIYIFCTDPSEHEQCTKKWMKIKGVHTSSYAKDYNW